MRLEVLISCMYQTDTSIIERTGIESDVLVVNQCDHNGEEAFDFTNKKGKTCHARILHTTERGLSRSRNMAIAHARGDVCLVCDDDERMEPDYTEKILGAFEAHPDCHILAFALHHPTKRYPNHGHRIGYFRSAKIGSIQIAFRKCNLVTSTPFCEKMGSGTGNGAGEENKFLVDCLRKGARIRFVPSVIASVAQTTSQWWHGYNEKYWLDRGWTARMIYGAPIGAIYLCYTIIWRIRQVEQENSWWDKTRWLIRGFAEMR